MVKHEIQEPDFTYLGLVTPASGYRESPLFKNVHVESWMERECISTGEYSYTRGTRQTVYKGTSKYRFSEPTWNEDAFSKAWQMVTHRWSVVPKSGIADNFEDWIDMRTSPGYPYSLLYNTKKQALADPVLYTYVQDCFANVYCNGLWNVRCKSEPAKKKKLLEDNGRVIVSAPFDVQVAGARLFGPMNNAIYGSARKHQIPCTVGLSKFYRGWHQLYNRLWRSGKFRKGLELDYTNYDGTCTLREFECVMNLRFGLLRANLQTSHMKEAFKRYYTDIVYTKMVLDNGEVVMKHLGNPSGQVNTIVDNSIINEFRWYYTWCCLVDEEYHNLDSFNQHCELLTCGDDSVLTGSAWAEENFRPEAIFQIFERHGWKPKFAVKEWTVLHELSYCSQNFRWLNGWIVPVPNNYPKLLSSLLYGGDRRDARETLGRLLGVKIEAYFLTGFRSALDRLISELFEKYYLALKRKPLLEEEFTYEELCILNRDYSAAYGLYLLVSEDTDHVLMGPVPFFDNSHLVDIL